MSNKPNPMDMDTEENDMVEVTPDITPSDQNMDDELRSEATFQLKIENFSKMTDTKLSEPHFVRNLPWKIMAMPRVTGDQRSLGFFLQCNADCDTNWSCSATAELRMLNFKPDTTHFVRKIKHTFFNKENDWGFSTFLSFTDIMDVERGNIQNDTIILEVYVMAEAPHGCYWDSKKLTGFVGLKNQGATCYMNSLLQTLFFTNSLRQSVYMMPTEADDSSKSVALALQRVFHDLQFSNKPVGTKKLTKSFGWETLDSFMQHDVQEFLRVLLDKLEVKMKATSIEGTIPRLFAGKMISYIKCKLVNYKSTKIETFYDIQLNIKGKKNVAESFADYVETEILDDDNKYDAGEHGLQPAEKGVIFASFPPVLHLHLLRFQYDPMTNNSIKFNDRFEFDEKISLDAYLEKPEDTPAIYVLHAVLVHSGDNHGGHYVVFINPRGDGNWCKFDDDVVSPVPKTAAVDQNYGGNEDDFMLNVRNCTNAYMLVYVRESAMKTMLQEVTEADIPADLNDKLSEEKRLEAAKRKERIESSNYMQVNIILEDYFECHQAGDLFNTDVLNYRQFKVRQYSTLDELVKLITSTFNTTENKMRIWSLTSFNAATHHHHTTGLLSNGMSAINFRDSELLQKNVTHFTRDNNPWIIFLELLMPDSNLLELPPYNPNEELLIFFKNYDPFNKNLNYCGFNYYSCNKKFVDLIPDMNKWIGMPADTELDFYKQKTRSSVDKVGDATVQLDSILKNGDIIIFEKRAKDVDLELPTSEDYFNDLLYRIEVIFMDKTNTNDAGFPVELSIHTTYDQMAKAVGQRINIDPYEIQFFKCQNYKEIPGQAIPCSFDGVLKDLIIYNKPKSNKRTMFYQRLSMNINDLENKKPFRCQWMLANLKEVKDITLYPSKNGTVKNLLEEAAKVVKFTEHSTKKLRICELHGYKIHNVLPSPAESLSLDKLQMYSETSTAANQKNYRIEEIALDEQNLDEAIEMLIPVVHFNKNLYTMFGIPFLIKIVEGEPFSDVKERIQKKLGLSNREWDKYKLAQIKDKNVVLVENDTDKITLEKYRVTGDEGFRAYLGLEHVNKSAQYPSSKLNFFEKSIKIYN